MSKLLVAFDLGGTSVFALSGATAGVKHRPDFFRVLVLSFAAGNSGGIARDLKLKRGSGKELPSLAIVLSTARRYSSVFRFRHAPESTHRKSVLQGVPPRRATGALDGHLYRSFWRPKVERSVTSRSGATKRTPRDEVAASEQLAAIVQAQIGEGGPAQRLRSASMQRRAARAEATYGRLLNEEQAETGLVTADEADGALDIVLTSLMKRLTPGEQ